MLLSMNMVMIAGVNGFVGKHLARELHRHGFSVHGLGLDESPSPDIAELLSAYSACDLTSQALVEELDFGGADVIFNLAGIAIASGTEEERSKYLKVNVESHTNIARTLIRQKLRPHLFSVSSGHVYQPKATPTKESDPLVEDSTASVYVQSKKLLEREILGFSDQLPVTILRPFNHIGPGQGRGFLVPDLCSQVLEALQKTSHC